MQSRRVATPDGISWYVEYAEPSDGYGTEGEKEYLLMIPSGEGDCHSFNIVAPLIAARAYKEITPGLVAKQIATLLDQLDIKRASFWGSSSGGGAALALLGLYPERTKCAIVHEVPFAGTDIWNELSKQSDDEMAQMMEKVFRHVFIEEENDGRRKWDGLGPDYHERLHKNYVTCTRYLNPSWLVGARMVITAENLKQRPIFWTVGGLNKDMGGWQGNFDMAESTANQVDTQSLHCLHFPHVTVPEQMATYVVGCMKKVEASIA